MAKVWDNFQLQSEDVRSSLATGMQSMAPASNLQPCVFRGEADVCPIWSGCIKVNSEDIVKRQWIGMAEYS